MERKVIATSVTDACRRLRVGRATLYRWLDKQQIAAVREPGGKWKIFLLLVNDDAFTLPHSALPQLLGEYSDLVAAREA